MIDQKYLSHSTQIKIKILEDECLMLSQRVARIIKKREALLRKRDRILFDKGLES